MKLALFLLSCLLAFLAGHMVNYSIIFLSLEWFDSHSLAGIGYGLCLGPSLILGWFAGVYCDRYSPRKILLLAQNSFFISIVLLWFAFDTALDESGNTMRVVLLLSAALFSGIAWSFVAPARFATLPFYIMPSKNNCKVKGKQKLATATITLNIMVMLGFGLAPMLLKQILVALNWQAVMLTVAAMFSFSSLILLPLSIKHSNNTTQYSNKMAYSEIKAGLAFVKQSSYLLQLLLLASIAYLLMGPIQVVLPSIAKNHLGLSEVAQGNYLSLVAFSLILGGFMAMLLKSKGKLGWQLLLSILCAGFGIGLLTLIDDLTLSVFLLIFSASCGGIAISFIVAGLQHYSSDEHRGRVMSFYTIISQAIPAASGVGAGLLAQVYSPSDAMIIVSTTIVLALTVSAIYLKDVRQLVTFS